MLAVKNFRQQVYHSAMHVGVLVSSLDTVVYFNNFLHLKKVADVLSSLVTGLFHGHC